ncbi:MAG: hypothetical protein J3R72DRAFT_443969, partial [Linnemannia gamsii]
MQLLLNRQSALFFLSLKVLSSSLIIVVDNYDHKLNSYHMRAPKEEQYDKEQPHSFALFPLLLWHNQSPTAQRL